jgi:type IX secretion system PorP/SprF family membrane protein
MRFEQAKLRTQPIATHSKTAFMRKALYILFFGITTLQGYAQQDPQFSQYVFNQMYINPAATGADGLIRFNVIHRGQWVGYQSSFDNGGSPASQVLTAALPLGIIKSSIGLMVVNDQIAAQNNVRAQLSYAYHLGLSNGAKLSLGLRGGLYSKNLDGTKYRAVNPNDDKIPTGRSITQSTMDLGVGVWYQAANYFAGISIDHINGSKFDFDFNGNNQLARAIYLTAGYTYYFSDNFSAMPSVLVKSVAGAPLSTEGGLMFTYQDRFWLGGSYRIGDSAIGMIGANLMENKALRIGLAFDLTTTASSAKAPYSYEALVSYALPAPKFGRKSVVKTPRFTF